jgi:hypothetical protein
MYACYQVLISCNMRIFKKSDKKNKFAQITIRLKLEVVRSTMI